MGIMTATFGRLARLTTLGLSCGAHVTRYAMYRRLAGWAATLPDVPGYVLAVSGSDRLARVLGYLRFIVDARYPDVDIRHFEGSECAFAGLVSDQVLEHVEGDPAAAVAETVRVVRPGGLIVHTTCCVNPIHGRPDFWRFTPDGLRLLVPDDAELLEVGGWGNPLVWVLVALGLRFVPIPHARWHPLHWVATWNHPDWAIVTWLVMRKEGGERC